MSTKVNRKQLPKFNSVPDIVIDGEVYSYQHQPHCPFHHNHDTELTDEDESEPDEDDDIPDVFLVECDSECDSDCDEIGEFNQPQFVRLTRASLTELLQRVKRLETQLKKQA